MAIITQSIGSAGGRDFATLQAWEDAIPANVVTSGNSYVGECYNDSEFTSGAGPLDISGHTTDGTHTITLTTAAGQSFRDHASKLSNPLTYDASKGVGIRSTDAYTTAVAVTGDFITLSKLQIKGGGASRSIGLNVSGDDITVDFCIIVGNSANVSEAAFVGNSNANSITIRNTLAVLLGTAATAIAKVWGGNWTNCDLVSPSDIGTPPTYAINNHYGTNTFKNCAFFGATNVRESAAGTFTTCMSDATGFTGVTGGVSYTAQFENTLTATADFRAKTGASLLDAGTTDVPNAANDIVGTARPQGAAYDIGAWELVASGTPPAVFSVGTGGSARRRHEMIGY